MAKPLKSVTHGQSDASLIVTFPAAGNHCPEASDILRIIIILFGDRSRRVNNLP